MIHIMLVEDHSLMRRTLREIIDCEGDLNLNLVVALPHVQDDARWFTMFPSVCNGLSADPQQCDLGGARDLDDWVFLLDDHRTIEAIRQIIRLPSQLLKEIRGRCRLTTQDCNRIASFRQGPIRQSVRVGTTFAAIQIEPQHRQILREAVVQLAGKLSSLVSDRTV